MRKFVLGLLLGVSSTFGVVSLAQTEGPKISGKDGKLHHFEVRDVNGKRTCYDPTVYIEDSVITCE